MHLSGFALERVWQVMFNLFAVVNVFWGNKIIKSIFKQHSGKGKGILNKHHFSKETKLCLFNINKYPEKCFARETVSSYLPKVWKSFIRVNMLWLGQCLFWISIIAKLLSKNTLSKCMFIKMQMIKLLVNITLFKIN